MAIILDIEVAGPKFDTLSPDLQSYLLSRAWSEEAKEKVPENTSVTLGLAPIIAIGMWRIETNNGMLFLEGESGTPAAKQDATKPYKVFRGNEGEMLEQVWSILTKYRDMDQTVVTFNGRTFDVPTMMVRSAMLGIRTTVNLLPNRFKMEPHTDLQEVFNFRGLLRTNYSLEYWCQRFGIESSKDGLHGAQIAQAYIDGRIEEIGEYCMKDCQATAELYTKVESTMLPVFD